MSGRAVQENIRFKAGSIGPTVGRANTEAESEYFQVLPDLRSAIIYSFI